MLRWNHDWGTKTEHMERLLGMGRRVPGGFANRPEMLPASAFYWAAFCTLETERPIGMAVGPIPWSKACDYAREHGFDDRDDLADFWQIIARLDGEASRIRRVNTDDEGLSEKVSVKDTAGVKSMMRNLGKKPRK